MGASLGAMEQPCSTDTILGRTSGEIAEILGTAASATALPATETETSTRMRSSREISTFVVGVTENKSATETT
jgi:Na+/H+-dicarboxylate symporter